MAAVVPIRAPADRGAEWSASIPDELTAREALTHVERALADAADIVRANVARYDSGTLPPPPWPKHAALVKAIEAMEGGRVLLGRAIAMGLGDTKQPKDGPTGKRLVNGGLALYRELAVMEKDLEGLKVEDLPKVVARAAVRVAATGLGGLVTFVAVLWIINEIGGSVVRD